jgi:YtcA family
MGTSVYRPPPAEALLRYRSMGSGRLAFGTACSMALAAGGCDPVINVQGSFFPAWIACLAAGIALTAVAHWLLALARPAPRLGPPLLIYPSLSLLLTLVTWLVFFRS